MVITFKYGLLHRFYVILITSPLGFVSYAIIRDAYPVQNYLYSILCIVVAVSFALFAIVILNQFLAKIIIDKEGISVKRLYNSYFARWEDISEYGRDQPFGYGGRNWRYYIKISGYGDKKLKIYNGRLIEWKRLNAHIISKLENSKLNNISPGMIG